MATTDGIVLDADSATYTSEALDPGQEYDVHWRFTKVGGKFNQGSVHGYQANSNGALSVSLSFAQLGATVAGQLHVWLHTLPPLSWDENGNPDPAYDHNFGHVLDKGGGDKAEATAAINP